MSFTINGTSLLHRYIDPIKKCLHKSLSCFFFGCVCVLLSWRRWQTGRLLKVIRAVPAGPLESRWWPGHIPKCSGCYRPQQKQAQRGCHVAISMEIDRLAMAQVHTFMVSDSTSLRSHPCLTAVAYKLCRSAPPPQNNSPFLFVVFFNAPPCKSGQGLGGDKTQRDCPLRLWLMLHYGFIWGCETIIPKCRLL